MGGLIIDNQNNNYEKILGLALLGIASPVGYAETTLGTREVLFGRR